VTLSALPEAGSYFGGLSGCTSVNGNQCILSVNDDMTVEAQFWGNSIKVMKPVEGEAVPSGSKTTVLWAPSNANHFTIKYSPDNGATWSIFAENVADVKYLWSVPKPLENRKNNFLKVVGYTKAGAKIGSAISFPFSIEVVKLTNPDRIQSFISGEYPVFITWRINGTKGSVAKVILEYTKDAGQTWIVIDKLTGDRLTEFNGSYPWKIPDVKEPKDKCKVRVRLKDSAGNEIGRDASDNYFKIKPS
jgi:hypothetical protein